MSYRLALLSEIPLVELEGRLWTLDLWVKDLQAQADAVQAVTLFSPVVGGAPHGWALLPIPDGIKTVRLPATVAAVAAAVKACDVVQIPGNSPWESSRRPRVFARIAHRAGKPVVLGISSDRATTHVVNARGKSALHRARARLRSLSVKLSQRYLARHSEGTFVVGEGLRRLVASASPNLFVGTASWVRASDIVLRSWQREESAVLRLCVAARLERMKGIHVLLEALAASGGAAPMRLTIAGQGPEETALRAQVESLRLHDTVEFVGSFAYPGPFLEFLRGQDIVVLTNLNDEQPRLVFDALSQGCLIVCPDSAPYQALGLPQQLLYERGNPRALAEAIDRATSCLGDMLLRARLQAMTLDATIETMHARRRDWVIETLLSAP